MIAIFAILSLAFAACGDSTFLYSLTPTGSYQNACGLGGLSKSPNAEILFGNAASLGDIQNSDAAVSLNDLSRDLNPTFAAASRLSRRAAMGIGYRPVNVEGGRENQFYISSSFIPTPIFWPGATVKYLFRSTKPALELDLSGVWNPFRQLRMAASIENVLGTALHDSLGISRGRNAGIGAQYYWDERGIDGVHVNFKSGIERFEYAAGGGVEKRFFRNPQIGLRGGGYYLSGNSALSGQSGMTVGILYQQTIYEQLTAVEYSFKRMQSSGESEHYVTVRFGLFGARDRMAPEILVEANRAYLSPDGDEVDDVIYFRLVTRDNPGGVGLKSWGLIFAKRDDTDRPVQIKAFVGGGVPPSSIAWDGRNSQGRLVEPGVYYYQFTATDQNDNQARTDWIAIQVK